MNPDPEIVTVIEKLKLQYEDALETCRRADARATQLKAAITALEAASAEEPLVFTGSLADACRIVLRGTTQPMSPTEVRDGVKGIGFHLSSLKHDNPMASIHSVLKRLVESGDAEKIDHKDGTRYRWTGRAQTERAVDSLNKLVGPMGSYPNNFADVLELTKLMTNTESHARFVQFSEGIRKAGEAFEKSQLSGQLAETLKQFEKANKLGEDLGTIKPKK